MSDLRDPPDLQRNARGGTLHQGAADIGLLAPAPVAFGVAGAIALSVSAEAGAAEIRAGNVRTTVPVREHADDSGNETAGATLASPLAPLDFQPISPVTGASASTGVDAPIGLSIHGFSVSLVPFGNAAPLGVISVTNAEARPQAIELASAASVSSTSAEADEAVNAVRASAQALTGALETLVARLDAPAQHALAEVSATIDGLAEALDAQIGGLPASVEDVLASANTRADDLLATARDTVGAIDDSLTSTLSDVGTQTGALLDSASDLVAGVGTDLGRTTDMAAIAVQTIGALAGATTDTAGQAVADVTHSVDQNLSDLVDDVASTAGLSGGDPLGGLVTLAGLVDASDSFEIVRESDALPIFASVAAVPDLLSSVGDVEAADADTMDNGLIDTAFDTLSPTLGSDKHGLGGLFDGDHDHG